jgi:hypothetical protein
MRQPTIPLSSAFTEQPCCTTSEPRGALRRAEAALARYLLSSWQAFPRILTAIHATLDGDHGDADCSSAIDADELYWLWCWQPDDRAYIALPAYLAARRMLRRE